MITRKTSHNAAINACRAHARNQVGAPITKERIEDLGDDTSDTGGWDTCEICDGEGRVPADGTGDLAGGYANVCDTCDGSGKQMSTAEMQAQDERDAERGQWGRNA